MRRLLPLLRDDHQRFELLIELGQLAEHQGKLIGGEASAPLIEQAIDAYSEALQLSPARRRDRQPGQSPVLSTGVMV